jgi:hypothetical protein
MTDMNDSVAEVEAAPLDGQVDAPEVVDVQEVEPQYFSWDEYAEYRVKLPVDGEEIEVPLKEALAGYQRQADYTRKTQDLAEQRKSVQFASAIQQALDNDPVNTIELLKSHYGVSQTDQSEEDLYADPQELALRKLDQRLAAFEEQQMVDKLESELSVLQARYGDDFDANEVVASALASGATNLESVYKTIAFDRMNAKLQAQQASVANKRAVESQVTEAKRQASVVSSGGSASSADSSSGPVTNLRDAFDLAKRQLGISSY